MTETIRSICLWADETFGRINSDFRVATRANEEMVELLDAAERLPDHAPEEAADVAIVLCRLTGKHDLPVSINDPVRVIDAGAVHHAAMANRALSQLLVEISTGGHDKTMMARSINAINGHLNAICGNAKTSLGEQIDRKMAINRKRIWERDGSGHGYHRKSV